MPKNQIPPKPADAEQPSGKWLDETACSARLSFIRVTTKGCEGTINLMWDDYPVAWVNNVQIAREMMREIPEQNAKLSDDHEK